MFGLTKVTSNEFMGSGFVDKLILSRAYLVQTYLVFDLEGHVASQLKLIWWECLEGFTRCLFSQMHSFRTQMSLC